jgi:hypothetical protein
MSYWDELRGQLRPIKAQKGRIELLVSDGSVPGVAREWALDKGCVQGDAGGQRNAGWREVCSA